jgi:AhpD family alkylhydroperoxidase
VGGAAQGSSAAAGPRISPGRPADVGRINFAIARLIGVATGGGPPHVFTTLGRHRKLFRRWLYFAGALMPGGKLPRVDTELLILRVAHITGCEYEWRHHEQLGSRAGLSADDIARVREGAFAEGWSDRQALLLRAADELHEDGRLSDELWAELSSLLSDADLIELCMLVGHYEMLAMTLNSLGVEPDPLPSGPPSRIVRLLERAT